MSKLNMIYANPRLYDIVFDEGTQQEAAFIASQIVYECMQQPDTYPHSASVFEPMSGSGRLIRKLWPIFGYIHGADFSERARQLAFDNLSKDIGKDGRAIPGNVALHIIDVALRSSLASVMKGCGRCFAAYNTINSFRELNEDQAREHLNAMRTTVLQPNGIYILGLHLLPSPTNAYTPSPEITEVKIDDVVYRSILATTSTQPRKRREWIDFEIEACRGGDRIEYQQAELEFTTYTFKQIAKLFNETGFRVKRTYDFGYNQIHVEPHTQDVIFILESEQA